MFPLKLVCGFLIGIHLCSLVSYQPPDFYGNLVTPNPFSGLARFVYFHECPARPCMTPKNCPPDTTPRKPIKVSRRSSKKVLVRFYVRWGRVLVIWHIKLLMHAPTRSFQEFENTQSMLVTVWNTITKRKAREMTLKTLLASGTNECSPLIYN